MQTLLASWHRPKWNFPDCFCRIRWQGNLISLGKLFKCAKRLCNQKDVCLGRNFGDEKKSPGNRGRSKKGEIRINFRNKIILLVKFCYKSNQSKVCWYSWPSVNVFARLITCCLGDEIWISGEKVFQGKLWSFFGDTSREWIWNLNSLKMMEIHEIVKSETYSRSKNSLEANNKMPPFSNTSPFGWNVSFENSHFPGFLFVKRLFKD